MAKIILKVGGMHCSSCEMLLKDALGEIGGVKDVSASRSAGTVSVEFDRNIVAEASLVRAIEQEGYSVGK